jgi:predicted transcriptional regulator
MMTAAQMRAARAMLGIDQRQLAEMAGVSVPTIQRMERSNGTVRGMIESLTRVVEALERAGIVLIGENAASGGGGLGVRFKAPP